MTIEELKSKIVEIITSHQNKTIKAGLINLLFDSLAEEDKASIPKIVEFREQFDHILEGISQTKYQELLERLNHSDLYNHSGILKTQSFAQLLIELSSQPDMNMINEVLSATNIKNLSTYYRRFIENKQTNNNSSPESSNTPATTSDTRNTTEEGKISLESSNTPATTSDTRNTTEEEFQIQKKLSQIEIANAMKLRKRGPWLLGQMIDIMMNAKLDPSLQKQVEANSDEEVTDIRLEDIDNVQEESTVEQTPKPKKREMWGWIILGALALGIGVTVKFKTKPSANGHTTATLSELSAQQATSTSQVKKESGPTPVNPQPTAQEILSQYKDLNSLSNAVMNILNDKEITEVSKESKDKYANLPSAKDLFGPASY